MGRRGLLTGFSRRIIELNSAGTLHALILPAQNCISSTFKRTNSSAKYAIHKEPPPHP